MPPQGRIDEHPGPGDARTGHEGRQSPALDPPARARQRALVAVQTVLTLAAIVAAGTWLLRSNSGDRPAPAVPPAVATRTAHVATVPPVAAAVSTPEPPERVIYIVANEADAEDLRARLREQADTLNAFGLYAKAGLVVVADDAEAAVIRQNADDANRLTPGSGDPIVRVVDLRTP